MSVCVCGGSGWGVRERERCGHGYDKCCNVCAKQSEGGGIILAMGTDSNIRWREREREKERVCDIKGETDGQTDGQTDRQTEIRTERER